MSVDDLMAVQGNYHRLGEHQRKQMIGQETVYRQFPKMPADPNHPFFYHVYSDTLPPREAYLLKSDLRDITTESLESTRLKTYKRRHFYDGWNNYTPFEKSFIQQVKNQIKQDYGIDLDKLKDYGPRAENGIVVPGTQKVLDGRDQLFGDSNILRFCVSRAFDMSRVVPDLMSHLEWR